LGLIPKDLELDLTYEKGMGLYSEFQASEFNDTNKGEYDCIYNFLLSKTKIKFRKISSTDYTGVSWYGAYKNGKKVLVEGVHLQYHAMSKDHAMRMYNQLPK
jgi:hypothetical protein